MLFAFYLRHISSQGHGNEDSRKGRGGTQRKLKNNNYPEDEYNMEWPDLWKYLHILTICFLVGQPTDKTNHFLRPAGQWTAEDHLDLVKERVALCATFSHLLLLIVRMWSFLRQQSRLSWYLLQNKLTGLASCFTKTIPIHGRFCWKVIKWVTVIGYPTFLLPKKEKKQAVRRLIEITRKTIRTQFNSLGSDDD